MRVIAGALLKKEGVRVKFSMFKQYIASVEKKRAVLCILNKKIAVQKYGVKR